MPTKIWLKPEQLALYIKQLERFRDLYSQLEQTLESDRQGFQFKAGAPNLQTTLSVSMQFQAKIRQAQSQTYGDVLFFNKELASKVQDLVSKSIELTFAYRDLDLLITGTDRNTESGLNKIEEQLYQAKKQLRERTM
ncbi:hypothetical protein [Leuconostoc mesenteroides]|uniref:hypothetical protein n=1 Tax=Leuconostoc mesenteroides TaxID=1245 RepID=UPI00107F61EF|nr:hypothetical protein [Leuconostoc mesenteroides]QXC54943.1 hypothetical protein EZV74_09595 [Leuconostoc mesenteroides]TGD33750.1 hypothetical protein EIA53_09600 [Leuconostoc mesenteroides]